MYRRNIFTTELTERGDLFVPVCVPVPDIIQLI